MEVIFRLQGVEFVWDEHKAHSNADKHSITFERLPKLSSIRFIRLVMPPYKKSAGILSSDIQRC